MILNTNKKIIKVTVWPNVASWIRLGAQKETKKQKK